jgi:hypothetical protein
MRFPVGPFPHCRERYFKITRVGLKSMRVTFPIGLGIWCWTHFEDDRTTLHDEEDCSCGNRLVPRIGSFHFVCPGPNSRPVILYLPGDASNAIYNAGHSTSISPSTIFRFERFGKGIRGPISIENIGTTEKPVDPNRWDISNKLLQSVVQRVLRRPEAKPAA